MPNTLHEEWTWECFPEWERTVLQAVSAELSGFKWELASPSVDRDKWFGLKIWKSSWRSGSRMVGMIYCLRNVLLVAVRDEQEKFDLYEPDSIDRAVDLIHGTLGC